jgi:hypothetical protein
MAVPTDPEAYAEWRQSGKLPENGRKPPKREDSATSKPSVDDDESSESAAPVSETGVSKTGKKSAEKRIDQLTREREDLRRELEALKATGKQDAKKPEPSSVPQAETPKPGEKPKRPKQEDFKTWDEYQTADDQYVEDLAGWKAAQKLEEHTAKLRNQAAEEAMQARLNEAKARYGEEAEPKVLDTAKTVFEDQRVPPAIKAAIGRSKFMVDALYVMGSDEKELASFVDLARTDPLEALRKWFTVEGLVQQELGKSKPEPEETPPRASDGRFQPVKKSAPAPPTELNGNSSPPGDERDRAANTGNVRAFFEAGNRKDIQRWKGNG